ncbi:MAG: hypothetical protein FWD31_02860 [Planctomycetaceae bacterium]|nr:hypothetical protein [Planctomycetaceae bacterium]
MPNRNILDKPTDATTQQDVLNGTESEVELLVAYLDGELDAKSVRRMEDRLSVEPDLREKMTALEQTWDMLDQLETVPVDKELVRSTMEVVTLTIEKELSEGEKRHYLRKWLDRLVPAATLLMFGVIGYQLTALAGVQRKKQFVNDIPIIQKVDIFKEIGSFDFLKALSEKRVFDPVDDEVTSEFDLLPDDTPVQEATDVETEIQL